MERQYKSLLITIVMNTLLFVRTLFLIPRGVCKFHPTCSQYAQEALEKTTFPKAIFLIVFRVLRCNPFSKGGFDPIITNTNK